MLTRSHRTIPVSITGLHCGTFEMILFLREEAKTHMFNKAAGLREIRGKKSLEELYIIRSQMRKENDRSRYQLYKHTASTLF